MEGALFRPEVKPQGTKLYGSLIIVQPVSFQLLTGASVCAVAAMIAFCFWGGYARKEAAAGHLVPSRGIVEILPQAAGVYSELDVVEGQQVQQGQRLALVTAIQTTADGRDSGAEALALIAEELASLEAALEQQSERFATEAQRLQAQQRGLNAELAAIREQGRVLGRKLKLASGSQRRLGVVRALISEREYESEETRRLGLVQERSALAQRGAAQDAALAEVNYKMRLLPTERDETLRNLQNQTRALKQRRLQIQNDRSRELKAPVSGTVTALRAVVGAVAEQNRPAMAIVPEGSVFEAHLFIPTRAAGFVEPAQLVRLRYDAFPYQQFGTYTGHLIEVTKTVLKPEEVPIPLPRPEPVYRVRVAVDEQQVRAYGRSYPLQAGMLAQTDIVLAQRSLIEWFLEPLYILKGRS